MSKRGMSQAVAISLGYTNTAADASGHETPSIRCAFACGGEIDFGTDTIGRTVETCRRCRRSRVITAPARVDPDAATQAARLEASKIEKAARRMAAIAHSDGRSGKVFLPKRCANPACAVEYTPKAGNQKFCGQACATAMSSMRPNITLGIAGRTNR